MSVRKILLYSLLLSFVCFGNCVNDTHAQETALFTHTILYAKDAQGTTIGTVEGNFTQGTQLVMENNPSKLGYGEIARSYLQDAQDIYSFGVRLANGSYEGEIEFTFLLGADDTGKTAHIVTRNEEDWAYTTSVQVVEDNTVKLKVTNTTYVEQIPVLIGIYPVDSIFKDTTLTQTMGDTNLQIEGMFTDDVSMTINLFLPGTDEYLQVQKKVDNRDIIYAYMIKIHGEYSGCLTYQLPISSYDNKEPLQVYFLNDNGEGNRIDSHMIEEGVLTFSTREIGTFVITQKQDEQASARIDFLKTYAWPLGLGGAALLVFAIILYQYNRH